MTDAKTDKPAATTEGTVAEKPNEVPLLFTEFSWFPLSLDVHYGYLAMKARPELWGLPDNPFVILDSYFIHTYIHTIKNNALSISSDGEFCCFDTGLLTPRLAQIYAVFQKNKNKGFQSWFFKGWFDYTEVVGLNKFETIPNRPPFFKSPTDLFFDPRIELRLDPSNIKLDSDDKARLQKACPQTSLTALDEMLESRFERTKRLVMLSPRTAVPMYFPGSKSNQMLLLLPLHIVNMEYPDIAVAIEKVSDDPNADPNDYTKFYFNEENYNSAFKEVNDNLVLENVSKELLDKTKGYNEKFLSQLDLSFENHKFEKVEQRLTAWAKHNRMAFVLVALINTCPEEQQADLRAFFAPVVKALKSPKNKAPVQCAGTTKLLELLK